ncbi:hypothetical protein TNCT_418131, partial [Trichonephila clavata]
CAYTRLLGKVRTQPPYLPGTLFSYPSFLDPLRASTCFCVGGVIAPSSACPGRFPSGQ